MEHTTPIWRVIAVVLAAGAVAAVDFYVKDLGRAEDFATVAVITIGFTIAFGPGNGPTGYRCDSGRSGK